MGEDVGSVAARDDTPRVALLLGGPEAERAQALPVLTGSGFAAGVLAFLSSSRKARPSGASAPTVSPMWSADAEQRGAIEAAVAAAMGWRGRVDCVVRLALVDDPREALADHYAVRLLLPRVLDQPGSRVLQVFDAADAPRATALSRLTRRLAEEHVRRETRFHALQLVDGSTPPWPRRLEALLSPRSEVPSGAIVDAARVAPVAG